MSPSALTRRGRVKRRGQRHRDADRGGLAVVELALVLPVMFILVFGSLEICQRLLLRQAAVVSAYESARLAARRTVNADRVVSRGEALLVDRRVTDGTVTVNPESLDGLTPGTQVQVTVTIPIAGNTGISYVLPTTGSISVVATMLRE